MCDIIVLGDLIKENIKRISNMRKRAIIPIAIIGLVLSIIERLILKSNNFSPLEIYIGTIIFTVSVFILAINEPNLINIKFFLHYRREVFFKYLYNTLPNYKYII